jgi:hypothetical protein
VLLAKQAAWRALYEQGQTVREDHSKELRWILQYINNISEWYKVPSWSYSLGPGYNGHFNYWTIDSILEKYNV